MLNKNKGFSYTQTILNQQTEGQVAADDNLYNLFIKILNISLNIKYANHA
jgi:hypothetical protein